MVVSNTESLLKRVKVGNKYSRRGRPLLIPKFYEQMEWEDKKRAKHLYRQGYDLRYIKRRYPDFLLVIEIEDTAWREKGGCDI